MPNVLEVLSRIAASAQGAYALFSPTQSDLAALTQERTGDFARSEANRFLGNLVDAATSAPQGFELRNHQANDSTGFSATVFFDRSTGKYVLGIRGTEGLADGIEDIRRIGLQGFAGDQLVSLYRYYRKLTTPAGSPVSYSEAEIRLLQFSRLGLFVNPANAAIGALRAQSLRDQLASDVGITPDRPGSGASVLPAGAPLVVTGHSLGGHLALLFGRLFPSVTEHVYTYNAPGINPVIGAVGLGLLGLPPMDPARVTNVASAMGGELISLIPSKPGENIGIFTERGNPIYDHSIVPLTDALALYGAFATLSPGLATDHAAISRIISASSAKPADSLERALDFLRGGAGLNASPTPVAQTLADLSQRDNYYANLYGLLDGRVPGRDYGIVALAGRSSREIAVLAASDPAVRHALLDLRPFSVTQADRTSFQDSRSAAWLAARADMLEALNDSRQADRPFAQGGAARNHRFEDRITGENLSSLAATDFGLAQQYLAANGESRMEGFLAEREYGGTTVFASDEPLGIPIAGTEGDDRVFGGAADDSLEGGAGNDLLDGGAGADRLAGGEGNDTLVGGEGIDRLEGGAGDDAYVFGESLDPDAIVDSDGRIYAGAAQLTGGSGGGGQYVSEDGQFHYAFAGDLLVINGTLRVEGFHNGDLGINLADGNQLPAWGPVADTTLLGDFEHAPFRAESGELITTDEFGNPRPESRIAASPGRPDMEAEFPGTPGNTRFSMGSGDDRIEDFYGGDDRIELGSGDDIGWGGSGSDLVEGGPGRDLVAGGRGDDFLYAGGAATRDEDLDDGAIAVRSDGGDLLSGGDGDDAIFGDAEANLIEGGAGRDLILGGAGDDWIGGDIGVLARGERYLTANPFNVFDPRPADYLWQPFAESPSFMLEPNGFTGAPSTAWINDAPVTLPTLVDPGGDADQVDAGAGNDSVYAGGGDDVVRGGAGDDYIDAGAGADRIFGGTGNDVIRADQDSLGDYIDGGNGNDAITGGAGDDVLIGGDGDDRIGSFGGTDLLLGGPGRDFLSGVAGSAVLDGGPGDDFLAGSVMPDGVTRVRFGRGSGADILEANGGTLVVEVMGGVSPNEVSVSSAERVIPSRDEEGGLETLAGTLLEFGSEGDSLFIADVFPAARPLETRVEFPDGTIWREADLQSRLAAPVSPVMPSVLAGTSQSDLLYGSAGADILSGGQGDDWLAGGAGNDEYRYALGDGNDWIEDSDAAPGNADTLRLSAGMAAAGIGVFAAGGDYVLAAGSGSVRLRGGRTAEGAIERVAFSDGSVWVPADLEARAEFLPDNSAPTMPSSLGEYAAMPDTAVAIALPAGAISDPDRFDTVRVYAITAEGERLPDWLHFDAATLTLSGTPGASDSGAHELLLIAADSSGEAVAGSLTLLVAGGEQAPQAGSADSAPTETVRAAIAIDTPALQSIAASPDPAIAFAASSPTRPFADDGRGVGVPIDPLFREMQQRSDILLQTGRNNLGERYAEAIREFEERRLQREEEFAPPPPTDEEVAAWNSAMHAWHDRNPGFGEAEAGAGDGTWTMGWGMPGPGEGLPGGTTTMASLLEIGSPLSASRLAGAASAPMLSEGLRQLR